MKTYALTIKKTRKPITLDLYEDYLSWLSGKCEVANINYEDTRGLHVHCVIRTSDEFQFSDLKIVPHGWSFKMVPIYNLAGWIKYSEKDADKRVESQLELQELYENDPRQSSYIPDDYPDWLPTRSDPQGSLSEELIEHTNVPHTGAEILPYIEPTPQDYYANGLDIRKIYKK